MRTYLPSGVKALARSPWLEALSLKPSAATLADTRRGTKGSSQATPSHPPFALIISSHNSNFSHLEIIPALNNRIIFSLPIGSTIPQCYFISRSTMKSFSKLIDAPLHLPLVWPAKGEGAELACLSPLAFPYTSTLPSTLHLNPQSPS